MSNFIIARNKDPITHGDGLTDSLKPTLYLIDARDPERVNVILSIRFGRVSIWGIRDPTTLEYCMWKWYMYKDYVEYETYEDAIGSLLEYLI